MEEKTNQFLGEESIGILMRKYSIPCIISLLVGALYNIVDQIFIANASYLGSYGNAASSTLLSMIREIVFGVGFAVLLPKVFGLDGVLYSMPLSDILTFIIAFVLIFSTYRQLNQYIERRENLDTGKNRKLMDSVAME